MRKKKTIPAISSVELVSVPVVAHSHKLKAIWTVDTPEQLRAIIGIDLARELDPLYDLKKLIKKAKRKYKNEPL